MPSVNSKVPPTLAGAFASALSEASGDGDADVSAVGWVSPAVPEGAQAVVARSRQAVAARRAVLISMLDMAEPYSRRPRESGWRFRHHARGRRPDASPTRCDP